MLARTAGRQHKLGPATAGGSYKGVNQTMGVVYIADPHSAEVGAVRRILLDEGHDVATCRDGRTLLELITERRPDVLVLNLLLPVVDGLQVLAELAAMDPPCEVPLVLVVGVGPDSSIGRSWLGPPDSYLVWPYSVWQAVLSVEQMMYRKMATPGPALLLLQLRALAQAVAWYAARHAEFPRMGGWDELEAGIAELLPAAGLPPGALPSQLPVRLNAELSGRPLHEVRARRLVAVCYEDSAAADGTRAVAVVRVNGPVGGFAARLSDPELRGFLGGPVAAVD